jgi:hypothetical protein
MRSETSFVKVGELVHELGELVREVRNLVHVPSWLTSKRDWGRASLARHSLVGTCMRPEFRSCVWNVVGFFVFLLLAASRLAAETRVTLSQVPLHAAPTARSRVLATVPAGTQLSIESCSKVWCTASWNGASIWVARRDLSAPKDGEAPPKRSGKEYYINIDGKKIPSPRMSPTGPPAGATAQCNDGSYSFSTHRRGTCSHHGGVRRWL